VVTHSKVTNPAILQQHFNLPCHTRISCFSVFRSKSLKFINCQYLWTSVTSYFQTSSDDILFSLSLPHFSCPPCLEYLPPRALILLRLWRYVSPVLTYLLTCMASAKFYPKLENLATPLGKVSVKSLKRTSYDIKKQRITKFLCVIFFHFKAFSCIP